MCVFSTASAHADDTPPADETATKVDKANADKADKADKKKLDFSARVFARSAFVKTGDDDAIAQTTLQSVRAGVDYRLHELRMQVEVEVVDKAKIKDAYIQLRVIDAPKLDIRAGNFKMPFSAIQGESIWTLPMADRGLVDNVLVKRLQVAGRAVGAMASLDLGGPHHLTFRLGGFQGLDDAGQPLDAVADDGFGQDGVARVSVRPTKGVEVGIAGSVRSGALIEVPVNVQHAYAAEVDVTADVPAGPGRVRAWLEGMIGTSWLVADNMETTHELTRFLEARVTAAYRFSGDGKGARYVEPYVLAAVVDPDGEVANDYVRELAGGITYGANDRWRIQLEAEAYRFGDAAPLGITALAVAPADSLALLVQLGARI